MKIKTIHEWMINDEWNNVFILFFVFSDKNVKSFKVCVCVRLCVSVWVLDGAWSWPE